MKISPNFMKSLSNRYAKASMMNTLKENLEKRQEKTDDYFADMYNIAETKGLPAYEEATARAKDLKRVSATLTDMGYNDAEILALAHKPQGVYGTGLLGIEKAMAAAREKGKKITKVEIDSILDMTNTIDMPEGMTLDDGIAQLAGLYIDKAANDPNSRDEKNRLINIVSSALALNPKLNAQQVLSDSNIGGINAGDLWKQVTHSPKAVLEGFEDISFLKEGTLFQPSRVDESYYIKAMGNLLSSLDEAFTWNSVNDIMEGGSSSATGPINFIAKSTALIMDVMRKDSQFADFSVNEQHTAILGKIKKFRDLGEDWSTIEKRFQAYMGLYNESDLTALDDKWKASEEIENPSDTFESIMVYGFMDNNIPQQGLDNNLEKLDRATAITFTLERKFLNDSVYGDDLKELYKEYVDITNLANKTRQLQINMNLYRVLKDNPRITSAKQAYDILDRAIENS